MFENILDIGTRLLALLGAALGCYNFFVLRNKDRIKIVVKPNSYFILEDNMKGLSVDVVNVSTFPVKIESVGLYCSDDTSIVQIRPAIPGLELPPRMLAPQDSFSVVFSPDLEDNKKLELVKYAFARTSSGKEFKGTNSYLKRYIHGTLFKDE